MNDLCSHPVHDILSTLTSTPSSSHRRSGSRGGARSPTTARSSPRSKAHQTKENASEEKLYSENEPCFENAAQGGRLPCPFFMRTATCAFGAECKFYHPPHLSLPQVNDDGLPIRLGEKKCPFYAKHGICSFGLSCKFNHGVSPPDRLRRRSKRRAVILPQCPPSVPSDPAWRTATPTHECYGPTPDAYHVSWGAAGPPHGPYPTTVNSCHGPSWGSAPPPCECCRQPMPRPPLQPMTYPYPCCYRGAPVYTGCHGACACTNRIGCSGVSRPVENIAPGCGYCECRGYVHAHPGPYDFNPGYAHGAMGTRMVRQ